MRNTFLMIAALVVTSVLVGKADAVPSATMSFTPADSTPFATGNFTAASTQGGETACSVLGDATGTKGEGEGVANDGMSASGAITGLPNGHTPRWVITFSADMRVEVGVLNYQTGSGYYDNNAFASAEIMCSSGSPTKYDDDAELIYFNEDHDTHSDHAVLTSVGWTVNQSSVNFTYGIATYASAHSSRAEVTATAWATNWNALSGTAVAYDVSGTPVVIQSFSFE